MDPTVLAVLSVFGGATLTALAGFLGAHLQARRDHARWLRERRYEAYTQATNLVSDARGIAQEVAALVRLASDDDLGEQKRERTNRRLIDRVERLDALNDEAAERLTPLLMLGPDAVSDCYVEIIEAMKPPESMDLGRVDAAESALIRSMRKALKVRS